MYLCIHEKTFTLLCVLLVTVHSETWKMVTYTNSSTLVYQTSFSVPSAIACVIHCSLYNETQLIGFQDDRCYCSMDVPGQTSAPHQINLNFIFKRSTDKTICLSKGYSMHPNFGICMKYYSSPFTSWKDAQHRCNKDGGQLLNIYTSEIYNELKLLQITGDVVTHVGGFAIYDGQTTNYYWSGGGVITNSLWGSGEPNHQQSEFCISLIWRVGLMYGLADVDCSSMNAAFICEMVLG